MKHTYYRSVMLSMYRTATSSHLDLDIRYAAARNMQRIRQERRITQSMRLLPDVEKKYYRMRNKRNLRKVATR